MDAAWDVKAHVVRDGEARIVGEREAGVVSDGKAGDTYATSKPRDRDPKAQDMVSPISGPQSAHARLAVSDQRTAIRKRATAYQ